MNKKDLPGKQLFFLAITAFGIQFATALQMANMTSLYKFLGAKSSHLSFLWLAAPIAGLIIQPLVGKMSDATVSRYGKRIPYLFTWGLLATFALTSVTLTHALWIAAILFWFLECGINGSTESLRALTADLTSTRQKARAFAMQAAFAGVGSGIAATLPWMFHHFWKFSPDQNLLHYIPSPIKLAFFIGSLVLLISILWTIFHIKENVITNITAAKKIKEKYGKTFFKKIRSFSVEILFNLQNMPTVIKKFYPIQIFTWVGLFSFWLYLDLAIAQHFFALPPGVIVSENNYYIQLLEKGTEWGGICYGIYQFVSVLYALFLTFFAARFSLKLLHGLSLIIGGIGIVSIYFIHNPILILFSMLGVGIMWGSIMSLPYAIISAELPPNQMGVYLGLFNMTITLPQIACGLFLSMITAILFHNHAVCTLACGGICVFIAGLFMLKQYLLEPKKLTLVMQHDRT